MAVRIKFDSSHNVIQPTFVLATRSGKKLGVIQADDIEISDSMNSYFEVNFKVQKENDGVVCPLWDKIEDFKLLWCREWDVWFEIYVETFEENNTVKNINAISLGEAETSNTKLYGIEINTETDISRDDYEITVFYNKENPNASLLHRIKEKLPHYTYHSVATSLINIQRTFTFDGISFYDALQEIAKEINCIFVFDSGSDENGKPKREINVYDLESWCKKEGCGHRDVYFQKCPVCGSEDDVETGYGEDTTIFVTTENLAENITFTTDKDSVMNCFRLEGGDDLMTATIMNCNPNGSGYIWYISELMKRDMSEELIEKLAEYDEAYNYYQTKHTIKFDDEKYKRLLYKNEAKTLIVGKDVQVGQTLQFYVKEEDISNAEIRYVESERNHTVKILNTGEDDIATKDIKITDNMTEISFNEYFLVYDIYAISIENYNQLVKKYHEYNKDLETLPAQIIGYPALMNAYYNTIDMHLFLESEMMPIPELPGKAGAAAEAEKLKNIYSVSVQNLEACSKSTATSSVLSMAKVLVDKRYNVKTESELFAKQYDENDVLENAFWSGKFVVTDYSNEKDTTTITIDCIYVNEDYEDYVKQKLEKALTQNEVGGTDIVSLFNESLDVFKEEIKKYCLSSLETFRDSCQACLNIMIEQGVANNESWAKKVADAEENGKEEKVTNLYNELYVPYYEKNEALITEIAIREEEIAIVAGTYDLDGNIITKGFQTVIAEEKEMIQEALNFEKFISGKNGEKVYLWHEFLSYRREDTYTNENYISDGLNNRELFNRALEFVEKARKEIYKSSTLQHSITATLKNLLVMKEFETIVDYFAVGNWIRVKINDEIYRLRLLSYTIDFNNLDNISIEFSDVLQCANGISDVESILNQAASLTKGYPSIAQQASKGNEAKKQVDDWVERSLALTKMKIVDDADNQNITWDAHGILCKQYLPISDTYDDKQLKIINRGVYLTDDNWKTSKAGIGDFVYYDPVSGEMVEAYGVIADTLVGNLILSEQVGIYNMNNSVTIDHDGLTITTHYSEDGDGNIKTSGNNAILIQKEVTLADGTPTTEQLMYLDEDGNLVLNGTIRVNTSASSGGDKNISLNDVCDEDRINNIVNNKVDSLDINGTIEERYSSVMNEVEYQLEEYKAEVGQYMQYDEDGLTLGSSTTTNKTVIDNTGIRFKQDNKTVSYMTNSQLYIPNAVIENILVLGKFCFCPREDGGCSLTWQEDILTVDNEITSVKFKSEDKEKTVEVGEKATFTAIATGAGLKYQWRYKLPNTEEWINVSEDLSDDWKELEDKSMQTTFSYTPSSLEESRMLVSIHVWNENNSEIYVYDLAKLIVVEKGSLNTNGGNSSEGDSEDGNSDETIVLGDATTYNISISSTSSSVVVYYSDDVKIENSRAMLKNAEHVTIYKEGTANFSEDSIKKLYGKYACTSYVDGAIYYVEPNATFKSLNVSGTYGGISINSHVHAVTPAYRVSVSNSGDTSGENEGSSETISYTWEKYAIEQGTGVVREKLDITTKPSDAVLVYKDNLGLWHSSYTITEDGHFQLSEETSTLSGYASINGGDGTSIYESEWHFVYQGDSYTYYYKLTITDSATLKGEKVDTVTSNNINDYPRDGVQDGYWYVLT